MHVQAMFSSHPQVKGQANDALIRATELCFDCAQSCAACADACLGEPALDELRQCIRLNLDCADICVATGMLGTRHTGADENITVQILAACADACRTCGNECARHADRHEHCRICAEVCRTCEHACRGATQAVRMH